MARPVDGNDDGTPRCDIGAYELSIGQINVNGTTCTLASAIIAANTDAPSGGCTAGNGVDTLVLQASSTHTLTTRDNTSALGIGTGLPVVTSTIIIQGNNSTVQRAAGAESEFRIFKVENGGDLTLDRVTVRGGRITDGRGGGIEVADAREAPFAAAWAEGDAMTPDEAIEYALSDAEPIATATAPSVAASSGSLTPRESEIATLLARGLTNQQIADELVISRRTVEVHVANVMGKLGLESRTQVATWAAEQGLIEGGRPRAR